MKDLPLGPVEVHLALFHQPDGAGVSTEDQPGDGQNFEGF